MVKSWFKSRTFYVALLEILGGIVGVIFDGLESELSWMAIGAGVIMLILRKITSQPVGK